MPLKRSCCACVKRMDCTVTHTQDNLAGAELSDAQLETMLYAFQRFGRRLPDGEA